MNLVDSNQINSIKKNLFPKNCQFADCKIKLKITDFSCKCKNTYCSKHRYAEDHECSYDYKQTGNELLTKQLIKVIRDKLDKI